MNKAQYHELLRAMREDPSAIVEFRKKYRNVYPFSDAVFKLLMQNNAPRLVVFLNTMLGLEGDDRIKDFAFVPQEFPGTLDNKTAIFDIIGQNEKGEPILVEVQQTSGPFFMDRLLYYTARIITNRLKKSAEYRLPRIYVLSVLTCDQFAEPETYFHHVHFVKNGENFYPKLDFFFVEVEKFFKIDDKCPKEARERNPRAKMLRFFRNIIREEEIPEQIFTEEFYKALEQDLSLEQVEDELFLKEADRMHDIIYERESAFAEGEARGLSKGKEIGIAEGEEIARREMAKAMLADGVSIARISAYSGLTEEQIRAL